MAQNPANTPHRVPLRFEQLFFRDGLERIEKAYRTAVASLDQNKKGSNSGIENSSDPIGLKPPPESMFDEDGFPMPEYCEQMWAAIEEQEGLEWAAEGAEFLLHSIREAFLIILFHFWERQSNLWIGVRGKTYNHQNVMKWLRSQGYDPDETSIKKIELAAHCAKHGPGRACNELSSLDESYFRRRLNVTKAILDAMFLSVRDSGPIGWADE